LYRKTTLDNGLRILTSNMPYTRSVCIAFFIGVGSRYESDEEAGTSHFIEHVCFRGTPLRPTPRDISESIEGVGGILNAATNKEMTYYWCKVAKPYFVTAAGVLADMLLHSKFEPPDIEKERLVIVEEINMCKDSPSQQVGLLIDELLWPKHPLGRDIAGTKESMSLINRETMLGYMEKQYVPGNSVISIAGDIEHEEVVDLVVKILEGWPNSGQRPGYRVYRDEGGPRVCVEKRETEQAHLCLALPGLPRLDPLRFPLDLLNIVLGEGMSSRLFTEIRDKMGLAYSIGSYIEHFMDTGSLTVSASVEPDKLSQTVSAILQQLELLKETIPEAELIKCKEMYKGRLLLSMEDSHNVAGWLGGQEILANRIIDVDQMVEIIDAITAADLQQVARRLLTGNNLKLAVVGPVSDTASLEELLNH
jgi:predicted Zn-dependent peptidase